MQRNYNEFDPQALIYNIPMDMRLDRLEGALKEAREEQRQAATASPWEKRWIATRVEKLEAAVANEKKQRGLRSAEVAAADAKRAEADRAAEERRTAAAEEEKQAAFTRYRAGNPTATAAEFEEVWPAIRERDRAARTEHVLTEARKAYMAGI